jgi:AbrB family looped-hinge helix DNA binding protein
MTNRPKLTTVLSTKGQVILPKSIRDRRQWGAGVRLEVEDTPNGVLLKAAPVFAATTPNEVFGSLPFDGPAKSIEEMNASIAAEAKRRNAGDRY